MIGHKKLQECRIRIKWRLNRELGASIGDIEVSIGLESQRKEIVEKTKSFLWAKEELEKTSSKKDLGGNADFVLMQCS